MKLRCPHCGVSGSTDDSYLGRMVKCPKCQNMFSVTAEVEPQAAQENVQVVEESLATGAIPEDPGTLSEPAEEMGSMPEEEPGVDDDFSDLHAELPESGLEIEEDSDVESEETLNWDDIQAEMDRELADTDLDGEDITDDESPAALSGDTELVNGGSFDEIEEASLQIDDDALDAEIELLDVDEDADIVLLDDDQDVVQELSTEEAIGDEPVVDEALVLGEFEEDTSAETAAIPEDEPGVEESTAFAGEKCSLCGKEDRFGEPFIAKEGKLYCTDCLPADELPQQETAATTASAASLAAAVAAAAGTGGSTEEEEEEMAVPPTPGHFTIGGALQEAWSRTKGAKGSFWAFSAIMYLVILVMVAGVTMVTNLLASSGSVFLVEVGGVVVQFAVDLVAMLFSAGLLYMGVKRAVGQKITWRLGLTAFSYTGKILVATVLQFVMVMIGYLLLILPGIYLSVGYAMTLPLIIERGLSPWQAMEASRKAIHKVWWRVFGLYIVVGLLFAVAMIPLFLGLIWAWPMLFILAGVVYRHLFGTSR